MNTEVWHENNTNIYFNVTPPPELIKKKNCSVKCLNVNETVMLLDSVYKSIKKQNKNLLIMINPITIHATFTDKDVRIADNISKSTMMIAIHQLIEKYNDIIYIPVYDFYLKITDKSLYLQEDGRHINNNGVKILTKYIIDFIDECKLK
jgi:lysophospholipase L1-like esterase